MAKLLRSMRKVALRSSCFKYSKALVTSRWSILPLICCFWMRKICAHSRLVPDANSWLSCLKKLLRISGSLVSFTAVRTNCSRLLKNSASRGWLPKEEVESMKVADAAAPGSNSRSPRPKSLLSAATRCQREAGATSDLVGYNRPDGLVFAGRVGTGFPTRS